MCQMMNLNFMFFCITSKIKTMLPIMFLVANISISRIMCNFWKAPWCTCILMLYHANHKYVNCDIHVHRHATNFRIKSHLFYIKPLMGNVHNKFSMSTSKRFTFHIGCDYNWFMFASVFLSYYYVTGTKTY